MKNSLMKINKEKQREWNRLWRQFKWGITIFVKFGVIEVICKEIYESRKRGLDWDWPQWTDDKLSTLFYNSICNNVYPSELLEAFVKSAAIEIFSTTPQPTVQRVLKAIDRAYRLNSRLFRCKFGVLE